MLSQSLSARFGMCIRIGKSVVRTFSSTGHGIRLSLVYSHLKIYKRIYLIFSIRKGGCREMPVPPQYMLWYVGIYNRILCDGSIYRQPLISCLRFMDPFFLTGICLDFLFRFAVVWITEKRPIIGQGFCNILCNGCLIFYKRNQRRGKSMFFAVAYCL